MNDRAGPLYVEAEMRFDRAEYDNQTPSTLVMPNGTLVASFHRGFLGVAGRLILAMHTTAAAA